MSPLGSLRPDGLWWWYVSKCALWTHCLFVSGLYWRAIQCTIASKVFQKWYASVLLSRFIIIFNFRGAAIGICAVASGVGGILAPLIIIIGAEYWEPLPQIIFGASAIIAGALILPLPETKGLKLSETLEHDKTNLAYDDDDDHTVYCNASTQTHQ